MIAVPKHGTAFTLAVLISFLFPLAASAQSLLPDDAGTTPMQQQMVHSWWQSGQFQQAISALGSTPVMTFQIPILFGVSLGSFTRNFGDPRDGGARTHQGEDIMAPKDTPIVSPVAGVVLRTATGVNEGNTVYEAAPGGYTLVYMHLDKFAEGLAAGTVLSPGSFIGYVGNTGNAAGGATHLHFEVHNPSGTPVDPMPFLTLEFTPAQKIAFLNTVLTQTSDPVALAQLFVTNFRRTFTDDVQNGITLPPLITGALATVPAGTPTASSGSVTLPAGDLDLGSSGAAVVALQTFLINRNIGPAAARLADAGATGNFGAITQAALVEYQSSVGISPADGYYGAVTRASVANASSVSTTPANTVPVTLHAIVPQVPAGTASPASITRDLSFGSTGQDVLALQQFLNAHGFTVAANGAGSTGNETTYFGPATRAAVIRFQSAHAIAPAVGYVGPLTRAALVTFS